MSQEERDGRSKPGEGREVEIHYLNPPVYVGDSEEAYIWWSSGLVEDYANSFSPLVVKIAPQYPKAEVVRKLRDLANGFAIGLRRAAAEGKEDQLDPFDPRVLAQDEPEERARDDHKYALKGNNYSCEEECVRCRNLFQVGLDYVITTDNAYEFLCDDCARQEVPELLAVRSVVNDLAHLHAGHRIRGEV